MKHASTLSAAPHRQRGVTVIIAMLFLLILTIFAVTGFNSSTTNTRITGNMIARQESLAAAQLLIDRTISSNEFADDPTSAAGLTLPVDVTGDAVPDYTAALTPAPTCQRVRAVKNSDLDPADERDIPCMTGPTNFSTFSESLDPHANDSACAMTEWNVRAVVTDPLTGANVAANQGIGVRLEKNLAEDSCL